MKTHITYSYSFDELTDESKENALNWIRNNWYNLGLNDVYESIESLKGFAKYFNTSCDYAISLVPDRGEYIQAEIYDDDLAVLSGVRLFKYLVNNYPKISDCCPFTGVTYDESLLDKIRDFLKKPDNRDFQELINECTHKLLCDVHNQGEYIYSDESLKEMIEANEYQFTEQGEFYS